MLFYFNISYRSIFGGTSAADWTTHSSYLALAVKLNSIIPLEIFLQFKKIFTIVFVYVNMSSFQQTATSASARFWWKFLFLHVQPFKISDSHKIQLLLSQVINQTWKFPGCNLISSILQMREDLETLFYFSRWHRSLVEEVGLGAGPGVSSMCFVHCNSREENDKEGNKQVQWTCSFIWSCDGKYHIEL